MTLDLLNNPAPLIEQRTKINAAIVAVNTGINATAVTVDAPFVLTDAGGTFANNTATSHTKALIAGLGHVVLEQSSTGTLSVTQGSATGLTGITSTTATQRRVWLTETAAGVYQGTASCPTNLGDIVTHNAADFASTVGTFASLSALNTAFPAAANVGKFALIGGSRYVSDGVSWALVVGATLNPSTGQYALDAASLGAVASFTGAPQMPKIGIGLIGDSRQANATNDSTTNNVTKDNRNWVVRALQLSGAPGQILYFGGANGQRTDHIGSRVATAAGMAALTDVFLKCAVNDILQSYPTASTSGATAAANMIGYTRTLLAAGKRVWIEDEEGQEGAPWTAAMSTQAAIYNRTIRDFCATVAGVTFVQFIPAIADRTSATNKHLPLVKLDKLHDSVGGALLKAQYFLSKYPNAFPVAKLAVNPEMHTFTGDPTNPVQLLSNPGFATRTGGILGAGNATFAAWAGTTAVAAKSFRTNAGKVYYTTAGGTTGTTAPTHASGTVTDGAVLWTFVMSATNSIPDSWYIAAGGGCTWAIGTNVTAENSIEMVVIALFTAASAGLQLLTGKGMDGNFTTNRFVNKSKYVLKATVQIDDHTNLGAAYLNWERDDMPNPPSDGFAYAAEWNDSGANYTGTLGTYPIVESKETPAWTSESQSTPGALLTGTNNFRFDIVGAGTGFAIVRIRDCAMLKVS